VVSDLTPAQWLDAQLSGDAFTPVKYSENCLHRSDNTWAPELRISDLIPLKVSSKQAATDTSLVLGQAAFLANHHWEKDYQLTS